MAAPSNTFGFGQSSAANHAPPANAFSFGAVALAPAAAAPAAPVFGQPLIASHAPAQHNPGAPGAAAPAPAPASTFGFGAASAQPAAAMAVVAPAGQPKPAMLFGKAVGSPGVPAGGSGRHSGSGGAAGQADGGAAPQGSRQHSPGPARPNQSGAARPAGGAAARLFGQAMGSANMPKPRPQAGQAPAAPAAVNPGQPPLNKSSNRVWQRLASTDGTAPQLAGKLQQAAGQKAKTPWGRLARVQNGQLAQLGQAGQASQNGQFAAPGQKGQKGQAGSASARGGKAAKPDSPVATTFGFGKQQQAAAQPPSTQQASSQQQALIAQQQLWQQQQQQRQQLQLQVVGTENGEMAEAMEEDGDKKADTPKEAAPRQEGWGLGKLAAVSKALLSGTKPHPPAGSMPPGHQAAPSGLSTSPQGAVQDAELEKTKRAAIAALMNNFKGFPVGGTGGRIGERPAAAPDGSQPSNTGLQKWGAGKGKAGRGKNAHAAADGKGGKRQAGKLQLGEDAGKAQAGETGGSWNQGGSLQQGGILQQVGRPGRLQQGAGRLGPSEQDVERFEPGQQAGFDEVDEDKVGRQALAAVPVVEGQPGSGPKFGDMQQPLPAQQAVVDVDDVFDEEEAKRQALAAMPGFRGGPSSRPAKAKQVPESQQETGLLDARQGMDDTDLSEEEAQRQALPAMPGFRGAAAGGQLQLAQPATARPAVAAALDLDDFDEEEMKRQALAAAPTFQGAGGRLATARRPTRRSPSPAPSPVSVAADDEDGPTGRIVGSCNEMCPPEEVDERQKSGQIDPFEMRGDRLVCVKKAQRNFDADKQQPHLFRTMVGLQKSMSYLRRLLDEHALAPGQAPMEFLRAYNFLWDRYRAVRKDVTTQAFHKDPDKLAQVLAWNEEVARFLILADHELCSLDKLYTPPQKAAEYQSMSDLNAALQVSKYDAHLNSEQLSKTLTDLDAFYEEAALMGVPAPNEAEFRAYFVMLSAHSHGTHGKTPGQLEFFNMRQSDATLSSPIYQLALEIVARMREGNWIGFFKTVRKAPPLLACLAQLYFTSMRHVALKAITASCTMGARDFVLDAEEVMGQLHVTDPEELIQLCSAHGLDVQGGAIVFNKQTLENPSLMSLQKEVQRLPSSFVQSKYADLPWSEMVTQSLPLSLLPDPATGLPLRLSPLVKAPSLQTGVEQRLGSQGSVRLTSPKVPRTAEKIVFSLPSSELTAEQAAVQSPAARVSPSSRTRPQLSDSPLATAQGFQPPSPRLPQAQQDTHPPWSPFPAVPSPQLPTAHAAPHMQQQQQSAGGLAMQLPPSLHPVFPDPSVPCPSTQDHLARQQQELLLLQQQQQQQQAAELARQQEMERLRHAQQLRQKQEAAEQRRIADLKRREEQVRALLLERRVRRVVQRWRAALEARRQAQRQKQEASRAACKVSLGIHVPPPVTAAQTGVLKRSYAEVAAVAAQQEQAKRARAEASTMWKALWDDWQPANVVATLGGALTGRLASHPFLCCKLGVWSGMLDAKAGAAVGALQSGLGDWVRAKLSNSPPQGQAYPQVTAGELLTNFSVTGQNKAGRPTQLALSITDICASQLGKIHAPHPPTLTHPTPPTHALYACQGLLLCSAIEPPQAPASIPPHNRPGPTGYGPTTHSSFLHTQTHPTTQPDTSTTSYSQVAQLGTRSSSVSNPYATFQAPSNTGQPRWLSATGALPQSTSQSPRLRPRSLTGLPATLWSGPIVTEREEPGVSFEAKRLLAVLSAVCSCGSDGGNSGAIGSGSGVESTRNRVGNGVGIGFGNGVGNSRGTGVGIGVGNGVGNSIGTGAGRGIGNGVRNSVENGVGNGLGTAAGRPIPVAVLSSRPASGVAELQAELEQGLAASGLRGRFGAVRVASVQVKGAAEATSVLDSMLRFLAQHMPAPPHLAPQRLHQLFQTFLQPHVDYLSTRSPSAQSLVQAYNQAVQDTAQHIQKWSTDPTAGYPSCHLPSPEMVPPEGSCFLPEHLQAAVSAVQQWRLPEYPTSEHPALMGTRYHACHTNRNPLNDSTGVIPSDGGDLQRARMYVTSLLRTWHSGAIVGPLLSKLESASSPPAFSPTSSAPVFPKSSRPSSPKPAFSTPLPEAQSKATGTASISASDPGLSEHYVMQELIVLVLEALATRHPTPVLVPPVTHTPGLLELSKRWGAHLSSIPYVPVRDTPLVKDYALILPSCSPVQVTVEPASSSPQAHPSSGSPLDFVPQYTVQTPGQQESERHRQQYSQSQSPLYNQQNNQQPQHSQGPSVVGGSRGAPLSVADQSLNIKLAWTQSSVQSTLQKAVLSIMEGTQLSKQYNELLNQLRNPP